MFCQMPTLLFCFCFFLCETGLTYYCPKYCVVEYLNQFNSKSNNIDDWSLPMVIYVRDQKSKCEKYKVIFKLFALLRINLLAYRNCEDNLASIWQLIQNHLHSLNEIDKTSKVRHPSK